MRARLATAGSWLGPESRDQPADDSRPANTRRNVMPKGQQKSNKEVKKPKKEKAATPAPTSFAKGISDSDSGAKKKGK
jgi:hypothetical protein